MIFPSTTLALSGERFNVHYQIRVPDAKTARIRAQAICLEQTVEVSDALLGNDDIRDHVVGRIETLQKQKEDLFEAIISYAIETTGFELPQLLNVIFGNTAMQRDIRVLHLDLSESLLACFPGPRFGQRGIRRLLGAPKRPLLCTALKPMGLSPHNFAEFAHHFALGGVDIIKDDHGIANQSFTRFAERVRRCTEAVNRANEKTGHGCLYAPNITAPIDQILQRAQLAKEAGAGALMISPGLTGWDALRMVREANIDLPILSHPALLGSYTVTAHHGISHHVIFGQLPRLAGADATIFVNYGGRFPFSKTDCNDIVTGATGYMGDYPSIFPAPGGGMTLEKLPEMYDFYGDEVIFLIAGGLYALGPDLQNNVRQFRQWVETLTT